MAGIEQALVVYPVVVGGGFTVAPGDGTAHFGLVVNLNDPPPCNYAQSGQQRCTAGEHAQGSGVRSADHAPRPGGSDPGPPPGSAGGSQQASNPGVAGYDPATGLVTGPDGMPLQFGGTGGQAGFAGPQSWKQLLLAGVAP